MAKKHKFDEQVFLEYLKGIEERENACGVMDYRLRQHRVTITHVAPIEARIRTFFPGFENEYAEKQDLTKDEKNLEAAVEKKREYVEEFKGYLQNLQFPQLHVRIHSETYSGEKDQRDNYTIRFQFEGVDSQDVQLKLFDVLCLLVQDKLLGEGELKFRKAKLLDFYTGAQIADAQRYIVPVKQDTGYSESVPKTWLEFSLPKLDPSKKKESLAFMEQMFEVGLATLAGFEKALLGSPYHIDLGISRNLKGNVSWYNM